MRRKRYQGPEWGAIQQTPEWRTWWHLHRNRPGVRWINPKRPGGKEENRARVAEYYQTPEYLAAKNAYLNTPEYKSYVRKKASENALELRNSYIAGILGMSTREAMPELIELKRAQIQLKREIKKCKQSEKC